MSRDNKLRSQLHAAFNHGIKQDNNPRSYLKQPVKFDIKFNPVSSIPVQSDWNRTGDRYLSAKEVYSFWASLTDVSHIQQRNANGLFSASNSSMSELIVYYFKCIFALAGQRVEEVLRLKWSYVNWQKKIIELPPEATKTGRKTGRWHIIPLSKITICLFHKLYELTGDCCYIFPASTGGAGIFGFSKDKLMFRTTPNNQLKKHYEKYRQKLVGQGKDMQWEIFTPRDIRRTCKTLMGEAGISKEDRDRLQNHTISDVSTRHYDRYDYFQEKRLAMDNWTRYLEWIIDGCDENKKPQRKIVYIQEYQQKTEETA